MIKLLSFRTIFSLYFLTGLLFFFYSLTQIDPALSLSRFDWLSRLIGPLQNIGYYQRPVSAAIYLFLVCLLTFDYYFVLQAIKANRLNLKNLRLIIGVIAIFFLISYPAFSHDIFNYVFTAKTVVFYQKNPYTVLPIYFLGFDPLVSAMRWIHLPSAYAPAWIALSLPAYILGFGKLLPVLLNMKITISVFYLVGGYFLYRILKKINPQQALYRTAFWALNPLVLIESILSPHNDAVMAALAVVSVYLFLIRRQLASYLVLALSAAVKLMTIFLYPAAMLGWNLKAAFWLMAAALGLAFIQKEILPWYYLWVMPFAALYPGSQIMAWAGVFSIGLVLRYLPFIYIGQYNHQTDILRHVLTFLPIFIYLIMGYMVRKKNISKI